MDPKLLKLHFAKATCLPDILPLLQKIAGLEVGHPLLLSKETRDLLISKHDLVTDDTSATAFFRCFMSLAGTNEGREMCCRERVRNVLVEVAKYIDSAECAKRFFGAINNITAGNYTTVIEVRETANGENSSESRSVSPEPVSPTSISSKDETSNVNSAAAASSPPLGPSKPERRTSVDSAFSFGSSSSSVFNNNAGAVQLQKKTYWRPSLTSKQVYSTTKLANRVIAAAKYCRTSDSQEWFSRTIINLTAGNLLGKRIFSTDRFREDSILYILKFVRTTNNVALICNAFVNICSHNLRAQELFSTEETQLAFSNLARLATSSETAAKWCTKVLEIICSNIKKKKKKSSELEHSKFIWAEDDLSNEEFKEILTSGSLLNGKSHSIVVLMSDQNNVGKGTAAESSSPDLIDENNDEDPEAAEPLSSGNSSFQSTTCGGLMSRSCSETATIPDEQQAQQRHQEHDRSNDDDYYDNQNDQNENNDENDGRPTTRSSSRLTRRSPDVEDPLDSTQTYVEDQEQTQRRLAGENKNSNEESAQELPVALVERKQSHSSSTMNTTNPLTYYSSLLLGNSNNNQNNNNTRRRIILWIVIILLSFFTVRIGSRSRLFQWFRKKITG